MGFARVKVLELARMEWLIGRRLREGQGQVGSRGDGQVQVVGSKEPLEGVQEEREQEEGGEAMQVDG